MFYINALSRGGAERVIINLATKFVENGDRVILVTAYIDKHEYIGLKNIERMVLFPEGRKNGLINNLKRQYSLIHRLRNLLKKEKPDIAISALKESNFRLILTTLGLNTKTIISICSDPKHEYPKLTHQLLAKSLYLFASGIVFQTEDAKKYFSKNIQKKSRIIMNQIDSRFFENKFTGESHDIVAVGRLVEAKNFELLIKSYAKIASYTSENLYIYGEGSLRERLQHVVDENGLKERVFLPGIIENVAETIRSAKLFVLSSNYEGMPNALLEALALGLPCVATDCPCGGPNMLIEDGVNGLLVPINDEELLAEAIKKILGDEQYARRMGKEAALRASKYNPDIVFEQWSNYVDDVIRGKW